MNFMMSFLQPFQIYSLCFHSLPKNNHVASLKLPLPAQFDEGLSAGYYQGYKNPSNENRINSVLLGFP